jgi:hypothetical protein
MADFIFTLMREFHRKGIHPKQLQELLTDIEIFFQNNGYRSRQQLNLELENLGWGINIIDRETYDRIIHLLDATIYEIK